MTSKYTFQVTKHLTLIVTVQAEDQDEAEERASEIAGNTNYDEWGGAEEDDNLELIDEESCDDDDGEEENENV